MQETLAAQGHARSFSAGSKRSYSENFESDRDRPARRQKQSHDKDLPVPPIPTKYRSSSASEAAPQQQAAKQRAKPSPNDITAHRSATATEKAEIRSAMPAEDSSARAQSPYRNRIPSPPRLPAVSEEFEWDDQEIF